MSITPLDLGSLLGTLGPEGQVLQQYEILRQLQEQELAKRTAGLQQGAAQAEGAYTGAAAQPPPGFLPGDTFVPSLLGSIASVIGQSPQYAEQAQQGIKANRAALLEARQQNLTALRDVYTQKADEAQRAGDLETELGFRTKLETLSKTLETVSGGLDRAQRLKLEEMQQKGATARAKIAAAPKALDATDLSEVPFYADAVVTNQMKMPNVPKELRGAVLQYNANLNRKIMPDALRKSVNETQSALDVVEQLRGLSSQVHKAEGFLGSTLQAGEIALKKLQQDPVTKAYFGARQTFAATIARAGGERGALTKQDIAFALALIPAELAGAASAALNYEILADFLTRRQESAIRAYTEPNAGITPRSKNPAKDEALRYAQSGDIEKVKAIIRAHPMLDNDPDLRQALGL